MFWASLRLFGLLAAFACLAVVSLTAAPAKKSPSRPVVESAYLLKIDGAEYLEISEFARRSGLKAGWLRPSERFSLKTSEASVELTPDSREIAVNGKRVLMGSAARWARRKLYVSRIDAEKLLLPLLRPGHGQATIPDLKVIAIDPGHGGNDFGMLNEQLKLNEKVFALDTSIRLKKLLEAQGYRVVMTRTDDRRVELTERPAIAARAGADLLISVHYNALEGPPRVQTVTGTEVYRFTPRYQVPVNRSERETEDSIESEADDWGHWNALLGFSMQEALVGKLGTVDRGFKHRKLAVLRHAKCPAVLIEAGFLSHDAEARKIATPAYRQQIAEAIAAGVKEYAGVVTRLRAARK